MHNQIRWSDFATENWGTSSTTTMPIITWTVTKGIPPWLHQPKSTANAANAWTSKPKRSRKWVASESESESASEDSEPVKKTKCKKRQHIDIGSEVEVEFVGEDAEPAEKEVEEVDAGGDSRQDNQEEVSKDSWAICKNSLSFWEDDLNEHQREPDLQEQPTKKETMLDLLTMMSDWVTVKFKLAGEKHVTKIGHWCITCK